MRSQKADLHFIKPEVSDEKLVSVQNITLTPRSENNCNNLRNCKSCNQLKPLFDYPKKGAGRYEDKCKPCHNRLKKERRQSGKPAAWSVKTILHSVEFTNNQNYNFIDVLYSILKAEGLDSSSEQLTIIDSFIKNTSAIEEIIKKKGDSV